MLAFVELRNLKPNELEAVVKRLQTFTKLSYILRNRISPFKKKEFCFASTQLISVLYFKLFTLLFYCDNSVTSLISIFCTICLICRGLCRWYYCAALSQCCNSPVSQKWDSLYADVFLGEGGERNFPEIFQKFSTKVSPKILAKFHELKISTKPQH